MKSLPWGRIGQINMRGKKSKALMAGKYVEDVVRNYTEAERIKWEDRLAREEAYWHKWPGRIAWERSLAGE